MRGDVLSIEVLYFDGCPNHERVLPTVRRLAGEVRAELTLRRVESLEQAEAERFLGSPTVRVDGADVEPGASIRTDYGLKCRLFRLDGRHVPAPPEQWIRAAIALARAAREEPKRAP